MEQCLFSFRELCFLNSLLANPDYSIDMCLLILHQLCRTEEVIETCANIFPHNHIFKTNMSTCSSFLYFGRSLCCQLFHIPLFSIWRISIIKCFKHKTAETNHWFTSLNVITYLWQCNQTNANQDA